MRIVFFDTETTGLPPKGGNPLIHFETWPRVVQIAWMACTTESKSFCGPFTRGPCNCRIIKVDVPIPAEATAVHGITTKQSAEFGFPEFQTLWEFAGEIARADTDLIVAHNADFDLGVVRAGLLRYGLDFPATMSSRNQLAVCTMKLTTTYCRLPGRGRGYKWPRLEELADTLRKRKAGTIGQYQAHSADGDVRTLCDCFEAIMSPDTTDPELRRLQESIT